MFKTSRRTFMLGSASLGLTVALPQTAYAQEMRSVTTQYGTYDIPAAPKRVVAIDSRLDLQPALALGLPVIGHGLSEPALRQHLLGHEGGADAGRTLWHAELRQLRPSTQPSGQARG
jgi:ABC-type enterochelin transport system substrate-binding protein